MVAVFVLLLSTFGIGQHAGNAGPQQTSTETEVLLDKAQAGNADAQLSLGEAYENGKVVAQNDAEALRWYKSAAEQGNGEAQLDVGVFYWLGRGVTQDKQVAVQWYRKAAKAGNAGGMFNLGVAYYNGEGVNDDPSEALAWFLLAQDKGNKAAVGAVQRSEGSLKPSEINDAYLSIGQKYETGREIDQDFSAAAAWYRRGTDRKDPRAAVKLANLYATGSGTPQDFQQTLHWCEVAANLQYPGGMYCLGRLELEGRIGSKNSTEAAHWFEKGAWLGDASSCQELGRMYWTGDGVSQDKVSAYAWTLLASTAIPDAKKDAETYRASMTEKEIKKAEAKVAAYLKTARLNNLRIHH